MTITTDTAPPKPKSTGPSRCCGCSRPCMIVLIVLPMSWLALFAFTDKARHPTLQNFVTLFTDPDFLDPLLTTAIIATTSAVICCLVAAPIGWLVSRTDMPGRQTIRALVTASFVTPPFLGAVAWELLAAPNSGLLNQLYRFVTGGEVGRLSVQHLFADRNHLRHLLLHVSVRVRAGRQRARQHAGRTRRRLRHSRRQGLDHGAARHDSAGAAGAGRRRADRLPAGDDAVRFARDPGAAGRLPHHDHENLEPVPVSAETRARRRRRGAAAAADDIAAAGPEIPARPPRLFGGRRQIWRAARDRTEAGGAGWRWRSA